ncbi:hypothetical protein V6N13_000201 [Hibiscus sabdariffa]|uniref:Uncharacterized protein n=2 Tax=Hibiscus sabdariffa TaxID=183260 RepID=A0ABR2ATH3_9ROSI
MLKLKEEEIQTKGKDQKKLHIALKKLHKMKESKPTMAFEISQSLKEREEKEDMKRRGCHRLTFYSAKINGKM